MADHGAVFNLILVVLIILGVPPAIFAAFITMDASWKAYLAAITTLTAVFFTLLVRYMFLRNAVLNLHGGTLVGGTTAGNLLHRLPAAYFLFVLGSGGHTTEMLELIRQTAAPAPNIHRRYIFTTGDVTSLAAVLQFERRIKDYFGNNGGTWDAYQVRRARNVHQPFYTAWFTALLSLTGIYTALTAIPDWRRDTPEDCKAFRFPHVITTNGPGNGVMVALVARLLTFFGLAPQNRMKVVFIETWAHISSLSLTGKIFHHLKFTGIVHTFLVQHERLSKKYGYPVFDFITSPLRQQQHEDDSEDDDDSHKDNNQQADA